MNSGPERDVEPAVGSAGAESARAARDAATPDEPLDAIVYDVHPALARRYFQDVDSAYPYAPSDSPRPELPPPTSESPTSAPPGLTGGVLQWADNAAARLGRLSDQYVGAISRPADFVVPRTFGMSAILGMMTTLAVVFGVLRWMGAYPVFYFFFAALALGICLAQMLYGQAPRLASIVMGAVLLPGFTIIALMFSSFGPQDVPAAGCVLMGFVPLGAFLGYLTGTCAAGTFLVMEYLEPYLQGRGLWRVRRGHSP